MSPNIPPEAVKRFSRKGTKHDSCEDTLKETSMFSSCTPSVLEQICDSMEEKSYSDGHVLCVQHEPQEEMFVIKENAKISRYIITIKGPIPAIDPVL